eukprot:2177447-Prymnesium_polylepis.1
MVWHARAVQTTGATLVRHACYTRKTQTPRYGPRGGAPCRNVTSSRWRLGSQRADAYVSGPKGGGSTQQ